MASHTSISSGGLEQNLRKAETRSSGSPWLLESQLCHGGHSCDLMVSRGSGFNTLLILSPRIPLSGKKHRERNIIFYISIFN